MTTYKVCRCCNKEVTGMGEVSDPHPIHTKCIAKHWQNHANGISAGRCHEFAKKMSRSGPCGGRTWAAIIKGNTP